MADATHTPGPILRQPAIREGHDIGVWLVGANLDGLIGAALPWPTEKDSGDLSRVEANARLLAAAYTSYDRHFGPNAIAAAEADLLGDCLDQIRAALAELDNVTASTDTEADYLGCAENRLRAILSRAGKLKGVLA